ncbi:MAG TPA: folate-binding protein YgfZ [Legionellaceae bacterium]|nr:folate-binding protein YgfZ [Legionellaceae bacterium]
MKPMFTYLLNDRAYTAHSLAEDLSFAPNQPLVFDLAYLGVLDLLGEMAATYLQGQITCDVLTVTPQQMKSGALCNLQGRIMALLDVVQWKGLHLVLPQDLLLFTQQSLNKSAVFSRVTIEINTEISFLGLYIPNKTMAADLSVHLPNVIGQVTQTEAFCIYALSDTLFLVMIQAEKKADFLADYAFLQLRGSLAWHYLELQIPRFYIYPNTRGIFLPHRLGLQHTSYISFNKGCYKGQEIIARTHYRATIKHELRSFTVKSNEPIFAGQKIYDSNQQTEIGEIIDYCPIEAQHYFLVVSILIAHHKEIHLEQHQQPIIT